MPALAGFTNEELRDELARREQANKTIPRPVANPDFKGLIEMCCSHVDDLANDNVHSDSKEYIYETAMETVFGVGVFDWINKQL